MGKMGYRHPTIIGNPYIGQCSVVSSWWCYDPQFWAHESTFDHGTDGNWETFCGILTFDPRISNFKGLSNCKSVPAPCVLAARRVRRAPRVPRVPRAPRVRPLPCAAAVRAKDLAEGGAGSFLQTRWQLEYVGINFWSGDLWISLERRWNPFLQVTGNDMSSFCGGLGARKREYWNLTGPREYFSWTAGMELLLPYVEACWWQRLTSRCTTL